MENNKLFSSSLIPIHHLLLTSTLSESVNWGWESGDLLQQWLHSQLISNKHPPPIIDWYRNRFSFLRTTQFVYYYYSQHKHGGGSDSVTVCWPHCSVVVVTICLPPSFNYRHAQAPSPPQFSSIQSVSALLQAHCHSRMSSIAAEHWPWLIEIPLSCSMASQ